MERIVIATRNEGKARELRDLLQGIASEIESLSDYPEIVLPAEGERSYGENALLKARAVNETLGIPAIGDDSGLEVEALDGAPGIRSARYAGERATDAANNELLLSRLRGVPPGRRGARFRCAIALVRGPDQAIVVEGTCEGSILEAPRGGGGFGYDPLFLPQGESRTFAELPGEVKGALSHRGRAAAALRASVAK